MPLLKLCFCLMPCAALEYFLVTFHGGNSPGEINNIMRYRLDGLPMGPVIDKATEISEDLHGLRGMLAVPGQTPFYVLNAFNEKSRIMEVTDPCGSASSQIRTVLSDQLLDHPYGLTLHPDESRILISNQNTGNITMYDVKGVPWVPPIWMTVDNPRGVMYDVDGTVFVAEKDLDRVTKFSGDGAYIKSKEMKHPIGLLVYEDRLFVSSYSDKDPSVFVYNAATFVRERQIHCDGPPSCDEGVMVHPAGMTASGGTLYVLSQETRTLISFDIESGDFLGVTLSLPQDPEDIMLVNCQPTPPPSHTLPPPTTPTIPPPTARTPTAASSTGVGPPQRAPAMSNGAILAVAGAGAGVMLLGGVALLLWTKRQNARNKHMLLQEDHGGLAYQPPDGGSVQAI